MCSEIDAYVGNPSEKGVFFFVEILKEDLYFFKDSSYIYIYMYMLKICICSVNPTQKL